MQRVRTAVNACNAELRPLRHQLRYTTLRSAILKWTLTGMMLYLLLYTAFYIVVRNNYLFGLSENTSKLLMDQYAKDLMTCWHTSRNVTVPSATVELQYMTVDSIIHNGLTSSLHTGIQSNPRSVVVLHSHPSKRTEVQNVWYRTLLNTNLDAGSCIATAGNQDTTPIVTDIVNRDQASIRHLRNTQSKTSLPQSTTDTRLLALSPSNSSNVDYSMRCLPSFIIAGAMKCGTGELMKWLELHPNLAVGSGANNKREVHYFTSELNKHHTAQRQSNNGNNSAVSSKDTNISKDTTLVEYASFFPEFSAAEASQQYTFEKSPDYIRDRAALHSIRQLMPGMRIVVLLRNPALRALSEFSHHCRHGRFVKFGKEVHIQGKMFHKNTIVRNDVSYTADGNGIGSGANITAGKNSASHTLADLLEGVPKSSYKTLVYPCSAADAERYFTQHSAADGVVAQKGNASSNTDSSIGGGGSSSSSGSNRQSMSGKMREHTVVPELEHGFYDQQLANLLEIFPANQVLVLLQEDMYRHTFRTLRVVEEFLKIPCFDYAEYAFIPTSTTASAAAASDVEGEEEGEDNTDDGFYDTSVAVDLGEKTGKAGSEAAKRKRKRRKSKKGGEVVLKPPKRVPITYEEQMKHYKAELRQYLSSWHGAETSTTHLYYDSSAAFQQYLSSVYRSHNSKLSELLFGVHKMDAFSAVHLEDMGWDLEQSVS